MSNELAFRDAVKLLPRRNGKKYSIRTLIRWAQKGKLNAWKRGSLWFTDAQSIEATKEYCTPSVAVLAVQSPAQRAVEVDRDDEQLRKRGFYGTDAKRKRLQTQRKNQVLALQKTC